VVGPRHGDESFLSEQEEKNVVENEPNGIALGQMLTFHGRTVKFYHVRIAGPPSAESVAQGVIDCAGKVTDELVSGLAYPVLEAANRIDRYFMCVEELFLKRNVRGIGVLYPRAGGQIWAGYFPGAKPEDWNQIRLIASTAKMFSRPFDGKWKPHRENNGGQATSTKGPQKTSPRPADPQTHK